jgi:exosortase F-associated protein
MLLKNKIATGIVVLVCVCGFAIVRLYESILFYDPFLIYFKSDYQTLPIPDVRFGFFFTNIFFRYCINGILSLAILAVLFRDKKIIKFTAMLLTLLFVIISLLIYLLLVFDANPSKMTLFYLRRFLIQPLFLLLFIPGFYFHKKTTESV